MPSPLFVIGDRVRLRDAPKRTWTVISNDTGHAHTLDEEPAYQLQYISADGFIVATRFAYQSDIKRAE